MSNAVNGKPSLAEQVAGLERSMGEFSLKIDGIAKLVRQGDNLYEGLEKALEAGNELATSQRDNFLEELGRISTEIDQKRSSPDLSDIEVSRSLDTLTGRVQALISRNSPLQNDLASLRGELQQAQKLWCIWQEVSGESDANAATLRYLIKSKRVAKPLAPGTSSRTENPMNHPQSKSHQGADRITGEAQKNETARKNNRNELPSAELPDDTPTVESASAVASQTTGLRKTTESAHPLPTTSVTLEEAVSLRGGGNSSALYLHGNFIVTAVASNRAVLRQTDASAGTASVRVILENSPGAVAFQQGETIMRPEGRGFKIRELRREPDGQVTLYAIAQ